MGVLNVTPDSFFDGGCNLDPAAAVDSALRMVSEGASIIDIGGESSRPGAEPVPAEVEMQRVLPVLRSLRARSDVLISVDTYKASVARACLDAGADIINDITALRGDPVMIDVLRASSAGIIIMHMQGTPKTMQRKPQYRNVVREVREFLEGRLKLLADAGIEQERVAVDPGIGFGKTVEHNLQLTCGLAAIASLDRPVCYGASRKSFIGKVLGRAVGDRLYGTIAANLAAYSAGAHILRVHDVSAAHDAIKMYRAIFAAADSDNSQNRGQMQNG